MESGLYKLKDLRKGEQKEVTLAEAMAIVSE